MRRHWKRIVGIFLGTLIVVAVLGYVWLTDLPDPMPEAVAATESDDLVTVSDDPWLTFTPTDPATVGFVFYPGGRVPPEAYAPPLQAIAEAGYTTVVPEMPFGLAEGAQITADWYRSLEK